jgi:hypothetical protein
MERELPRGAFPRSSLPGFARLPLHTRQKLRDVFKWPAYQISTHSALDEADRVFVVVDVEEEEHLHSEMMPHPSRTFLRRIASYSKQTTMPAPAG